MVVNADEFFFLYPDQSLGRLIYLNILPDLIKDPAIA